MSKAKLFTIINYVFSSILWLLGILTLLFNILGLWFPWHLAGFGFIFYIPIPAITQLIAFCFCNTTEKKFFSMNLVAFAVSAGFVLLTVLVSAKWFW